MARNIRHTHRQKGEGGGIYTLTMTANAQQKLGAWSGRSFLRALGGLAQLEPGRGWRSPPTTLYELESWLTKLAVPVRVRRGAPMSTPGHL
jgi:hypothetical protein